MGKSANGIFGNFHGRIGNTVYYTRKGKQVARKIGINNRPPSLKQLYCRKRLQVLSAFFKPIKAYLELGFGQSVRGTEMSPYNAAVKYNLNNATQGEYPDVRMDYEKVVLSRGSLSPALNASVLKEAEGLRFSWDPGFIHYQNRYDSAMLLLYFPEQEQAICLLNEAQRQTGTAFVPLAAQQLNRKVHLYIAFAGQGNQAVSDSVYVGAFNLWNDSVLQEIS